MADQSNEQPTEVNGYAVAPAQDVNGDESKAQDSSDGDVNGQSPDSVFQLTVKLPHEPFETKIMVSSQEQVQDIRQTIVDFPQTFQYSCFHLEHNGTRVNDFVELSEVPDVMANPEFVLKEDPYTEREARMHVIRIRELVGAAGDRTDAVHGIMAGLSLHDDVNEQAAKGSNLGEYDFHAPVSTKALLPPTNHEPAPKTVKSISLSPWHPPPHHLRTMGHLLYIQVQTNEREPVQITAHTSGFYVNKSTNDTFDPFPKPAPRGAAAHSLLTLLFKISPSFDSKFKDLLTYNGNKNPLATFQLTNAIPASPWVVPSPAAATASHQSDITRSQETYLLSGVDGTETLRDWNEEFQSTRELPKEAMHERVFRERLTSKLFADYNEAATRGAVMVARGEVTPLNPTESRDAQIFVYGNVFFSFGADGVGTFATEGGDEAARVATGKDVVGVKAVNQLDLAGLFTPGTVVVDYLGKRIVGQSIVPGIFKQRDPGEHQIDYGGVEGKDVVAEHEGFVPLFEQLSKAMHVKKHAVWDREIKRHDLEASVETKGLIGTDGRKYVLDLYRVTPLDVAWLEQYWSEATKDGEDKDKQRNYPHRMAVLRPELLDFYARKKLQEYVQTELDKKKESRGAADRSQKEPLTNGHSDTETSAEPSQSTNESQSDGAVEQKEQTNGDTDEEKQVAKGSGEDDKADKEESDLERVDISGFKFSLNPDVFSGQTPQTDEEKEGYAKDEADVRAVCTYLTEEAIPRLVNQLNEGEVGFPMDGPNLTSQLHKRGINVRYLGMVASLAGKVQEGNSRAAALQSLAVREMIARGFKHVANRKLRYLPAVFAKDCIAHLLNCLLGVGLNANPSAVVDESLKSMFPDASFDFEQTTPDTLRAEITAEIQKRYRYECGDEWFDSGREIQMLREVTRKLGIQLQQKNYAFNKEQATSGSDTPNDTSEPLGEIVANGHANGASKKKKKAAADKSGASASASPTITVTFQPSNVMNIVPIVKEASPRSALAEEALDAGRVSIAQNQRELGQDLLLESISLHEQVYGILHPDVARAYSQLASSYHHLGEKNAAVELAHKAVIVSERTLGVDHPETIMSYLNLGLFEHTTGGSKDALVYLRHALDLQKLVYGPKHPDSVTAINNVAVILQGLKEFSESRRWFEASLAICEELSGKESMPTATALFQLSHALALDQNTHEAVNKMRESLKIFNKILGPDHSNTKEAESWLQQLTQSAVSLAKQAKALQSNRLRRVQFSPRMNLGVRSQPNTEPSPPEPVPNREADTRSLEELLKYIEGDSTKKTTSKKRPANPKRRVQVA